MNNWLLPCLYYTSQIIAIWLVNVLLFQLGNKSLWLLHKSSHCTVLPLYIIFLFLRSVWPRRYYTNDKNNQHQQWKTISISSEKMLLQWKPQQFWFLILFLQLLCPHTLFRQIKTMSARSRRLMKMSSWPIYIILVTRQTASKFTFTSGVHT